MKKHIVELKKIPKGKHRGSEKKCVNKGQARYYGENNIDDRLMDKLKKIRSWKRKRSGLLRKKLRNFPILIKV